MEDERERVSEEKQEEKTGRNGKLEEDTERLLRESFEDLMEKHGESMHELAEL